MKTCKPAVAGLVLLAAAAALPSHCFAIAISPGSDVTAGLGNTANAIVRVSVPAGVGSGTVIGVHEYATGYSICILTADHVIRDPGGGGSTLFDANQITVSFGNQGGAGASFTARASATLFDLPDDGSSAVDLAMIHVFVKNPLVDTLPANLAAVALPGAAPAAAAAIVQAGYGLQASVVNVSGQLAYSYSPVFGDGAGYGTLKAGPNAVGAAGIENIDGAVSVYAGLSYEYEGFQNGAVIAGADPNYVGSTSYIFSGDSGGPSLIGNTIVGVHSSSVTTTLAGDPNSEVAFPLAVDANFLWQDVSVYNYLEWINEQLDVLCIPEPTSFVLFALGGVLLLSLRRHARRSARLTHRVFRG